MTLTPGATSWVDVMTFGAKFHFHWRIGGDALENKKIVLNEQRKDKQFDGL